MTKQLPIDRARRLKKGCCPVHGIYMIPVSVSIGEILVECPRKDCQVQAAMADCDSPAELLPEWRQLIEP